MLSLSQDSSITPEGLGLSELEYGMRVRVNPKGLAAKFGTMFPQRQGVVVALARMNRVRVLWDDTRYARSISRDFVSPLTKDQPS